MLFLGGAGGKFVLPFLQADSAEQFKSLYNIDYLHLPNTTTSERSGVVSAQHDMLLPWNF